MKVVLVLSLVELIQLAFNLFIWLLLSKDVVLAIISKFGVDVGTGSIIEFTGEAIRGMTMEERMTICNMSIEAGAKAGLISPG